MTNLLAAGLTNLGPDKGKSFLFIFPIPGLAFNQPLQGSRNALVPRRIGFRFRNPFFLLPSMARGEALKNGRSFFIFFERRRERGRHRQIRFR